MTGQWALVAAQALETASDLLRYAPPAAVACVIALLVIGLAHRNLVLATVMYQAWALACRADGAGCWYAPPALPVGMYTVALFCALFGSMLMRTNVGGLLVTVGLAALGATGAMPRFDA